MITLIGCRGGDKDAPEILKNCGWEYGSRSDYTIYAPPYFIDIKWRDYKWLKHWFVVRWWKPVMAMVADYERPEQKNTMLRQVSQIERLGVRPMVCPKFNGAVDDIPNNCIVAVSVPTQYAGWLPLPKDVIGRQLHLLGGHPDQFAMLIQMYDQSEIISADCSAIFQKAQYGAHWDAALGDWFYVEKNTIHTHDLTEMSGENVREYLKSTTWPGRVSNRRGRAILQRPLDFATS